MTRRMAVPTTEGEGSSGMELVQEGSTLMAMAVEPARHVSYQPLSSTCFKFGLLGLLNNSPYVIMLASAKNLSEGGVALVYLANIVPGLLVKVTLPYWMDRLSYGQRLTIASMLMATAFVLVGLSPNLIGQLIGVACISAQCSLGEASLLALAGKLDPERGTVLTWFSSGTGVAGPFGYLYKIALTEWLHWSLEFTCISAALCLSTAYYVTSSAAVTLDPITSYSTVTQKEQGHEVPRDEVSHETSNSHDSPFHHASIADMSSRDRLQFCYKRLWPYIVPLFTVYAAEYACQGGVWTAIGSTEEERTQFYERSNWLYQIGVLVSRSSGTCFSLSLTWLWILPACQVVNLVLFYLIATKQYPLLEATLDYQIFLYGLATMTGLLGGAVYIHGYQRILHDIEAPYTEFALSATSMAESLGVLVANTMSLLLQACLYQLLHYPGALFTCPFL